MLVHWAPPLMAEALTAMGEGFSLEMLSCLKHGRFCHILLARRAQTAGTAGWRSSISLCCLHLYAGSAFWVSTTGFLLCGSSPSPPERGADSLQQTQGWFLPCFRPLCFFTHAGSSLRCSFRCCIAVCAYSWRGEPKDRVSISKYCSQSQPFTNTRKMHHIGMLLMLDYY